MLLDLGSACIARTRRCGSTGVTLVLAHFAARLMAGLIAALPVPAGTLPGTTLCPDRRRVAGTNLVARKGGRTAWSSLPMTFRRHSGDRLAWARRNDSRSSKQRRMCGRCNGREAVIAVERKRGNFSPPLPRGAFARASRLHDVLAGGDLFWRRLRRRTGCAAIVANIAGIVHETGSL